MAEAHAKLQEALGREIALLDLFQFTTVSALAAHLDAQSQCECSGQPTFGARRAPQNGAPAGNHNAMKPSAIAIVGMAGRFPGARNTAEFWRNLRDGVESIRDLTDAELLAAGATAEDLANPDYVRRAAILEDVPLFDASFFGFSPRDASIMDPQHRHFLECAWEALEDAAHPPQQFPGSIGVFAGSGMNTYLIHNLLANRRLLASAGLFQLKQTGNDKDVLTTRVSYQLDLRGPSINVQTACSTSLVAVHMACQSLLNFECDMALAGGVTIEIPHGLGYIYREGEFFRATATAEASMRSSSGTVFASGLGIVVLRRLEDALADHDHIRAVILGSAINNDGARKVGYLAPSVEGQAEVIREALDYAGVPASSISYVETHGTGTRVGDPIEVRALTQAFGDSGRAARRPSVRSNPTWATWTPRPASPGSSKRRWRSSMRRFPPACISKRSIRTSSLRATRFT